MNLPQIEGGYAAMPHMEQKQPRQNRSNLRTGLILASIALVFFFSVIVRHLMLG